MKRFAIFQLLLIALLMISGCAIESVEDTSLPVVTDKVENNNDINNKIKTKPFFITHSPTINNYII